MNISEGYRQIQEERDLIDRTLPALLPGKVRTPLHLHPACSVLVTELRHDVMSKIPEDLSLCLYQSHSKSFSPVRKQSFQ